MNNDQTQPAGDFGSTVGLGVTAPKRAESLREMIDRLERQQFEEWVKDYLGPLTTNFEKSAMWAAWQGRGALQSKCRGVAHPGCNYLAACGGVCNKCGQSV
jgi:hypothetical protein